MDRREFLNVLAIAAAAGLPISSREALAAGEGARLYDVPLGFEPAMGHTARGVAGRVFNCVSNGGSHFFTYHGNVLSRRGAFKRVLAGRRLRQGRDYSFVG